MTFVILERFVGFLGTVVHLQTFPVAIGYLIMIFLSPLWRRFVQPLQLNMVCLRINSRELEST